MTESGQERSSAVQPTRGMPSSETVEEALRERPVFISLVYGGKWCYPDQSLVKFRRWLENSDNYEFEVFVAGTVRCPNPAGVNAGVLWAAIAETEKVLAELRRLAANE